MLIKKKQSGMSIVELMISMALSTLLIGGLVSFFSSTVGSTGTTTGNIHLNQDFQTTMSFVSDEIRNTGYWADSYNSNSTANPFGLTKPNSGNTSTDCVIYSYDADKDGSLDNDETRAIRWNSSTKAIEYLEDAPDCTDTTAWSSSSVQQLTDKNKISITNLDFVLSEDCHNNTTDNTNCSGANSGDLLMTVQKIKITIDGELKANTDLKRHVDREVLLRNVMVEAQP